MVRPTTPPPAVAPARRPPSPPTPEVTRRIEENRLRAKALREQHEAAQRTSGTAPLIHRTASGFIATDDIELAGPAGARKRRHDAIASSLNTPSLGRSPSQDAGTGPSASADKGSSKNGNSSNKRQAVPTTNRDGRADAGEIRPARNFTKYVDYNISTMTDTKGGFLSTEDDPAYFGGGPRKPGQQGPGQGPAEEERPAGMSAAQWERLRLLRDLRRQKAGPFEPGMSALTEAKDRRTCRECGSLEIDFVWDEVFGCCVCGACKERLPEKYSLLTKTECREDYLLTEPELKDADLLPHLSRPNPHKSHWHDMMLFLRYQVEEYAFKEKWGSAEALDAEFARREADKKRRKEAKFKDKLLELKKKTRSEAFRRNNAGGGSGIGGGKAKKFGDSVGAEGRHVHEWGRTVENEEGMTVKTCTSCGMEVEELEF